jgi:hypothetical protein
MDPSRKKWHVDLTSYDQSQSEIWKIDSEGVRFVQRDSTSFPCEDVGGNGRETGLQVKLGGECLRLIMELVTLTPLPCMLVPYWSALMIIMDWLNDVVFVYPTRYSVLHLGGLVVVGTGQRAQRTVLCFRVYLTISFVFLSSMFLPPFRNVVCFRKLI